ncbi:hypothetical protein [Burkholderia gladioli]|uniref:Uncharacterized protein n=1 Tax=Burkholderia gladioli TaxID=28095 RepID=A0AB38TR57_BURGA|nr:hypothetical protein [Burkholderia gladioli]UWX69163.1 hypothetical protein NYZ96_13160 [Burkholderia gladioli]
MIFDKICRKHLRKTTPIMYPSPPKRALSFLAVHSRPSPETSLASDIRFGSRVLQIPQAKSTADNKSIDDQNASNFRHTPPPSERRFMADLCRLPPCHAWPTEIDPKLPFVARSPFDTSKITLGAISALASRKNAN